MTRYNAPTTKNEDRVAHNNRKSISNAVVEFNETMRVEIDRRRQRRSKDNNDDDNRSMEFCKIKDVIFNQKRQVQRSRNKN